MCTIHGCIDHNKTPKPFVDLEQRRLFVKGLAALPMASVLAYPELASAQATQTSIKNHQFNHKGVEKSVSFAEATPKNKTNAPVVIIIHEWWGLNDQIKSVAVELANLGYIALAVDLFDGVVAQTPAEAGKLTGALDSELATERMVALVNYAKKHQGANGKVAVVGWCFGGGWSLNTANATAVDACVIYYGRLNITDVQVKALKTPILGHFGAEDKSINSAMVNGFETILKHNGKTNYELHWYPAGHGFANPTGANYNEPSAMLSWQRTIEFLRKNLVTN